jgi:hypothetical protein
MARSTTLRIGGTGHRGRLGQVAVVSASLLCGIGVLSLAHADATNPARSSQGQSQGQATSPGQSPLGATPSGAAPSDATVTKAGAALRDVAKVQSTYENRIQAAGTPEEKRGLSDQATAEAMQAIETHGISVDQYSQVVHLAQSDPQVKRRLLDAASASK